MAKKNIIKNKLVKRQFKRKEKRDGGIFISYFKYTKEG